MKLNILFTDRGIKSWKADVIAFTVIALISIFFTFNQLNEFPCKKHSWTSCDRLAITMRYVDNNLKPLPAQTYVMNHQFPGRFNVEYNHSITAGDLPIYEYIGAVILTVANTRDHLPLRIFYLILSITGLCFLYKLIMLISENSYFVSLGLVILALSSPTFIFYETGFIAGIPALSTVFIATYFYFKGYKNDNLKLSCVGISLFTLAALARLPFSIVLIAISCVEGWQMIRKKEFSKKKWIVLGISYLVIIAAFIYSNYIGNVYGSVFLNKCLPARSFEHIIEIINAVYVKWGGEYFTYEHYMVFAIVLVLAVISMIINRGRISKVQGQYLFIVLVTLLGAVMYSLLMLTQFVDHDYYFIDTFYLPLVLLLGFLLSQMPKPKIMLGVVLLVGVSAYILPAAYRVNEIVQNNHWGTTANTRVEYTNFEDSGQLLDSLGIEKEAKILVYNSYSPNLPFILMNRCGYTVSNVSEENVLKTLKWNSDYIVVQKNMFTEMPFVYFYLENYYEKIGENRTLKVYRSSILKNKELAKLNSLVLDKHIKEFGGGLYDEIGSNTEFYDLASFDDLNIKGNGWLYVNSRLRIKMDDTLSDVFLIVKTTRNDGEELYVNTKLDEYSRNKTDEWTEIKIDSFFKIDAGAVDRVQVYIHNLGGKNFKINYFEITAY